MANSLPDDVAKPALFGRSSEASRLRLPGMDLDWIAKERDRLTKEAVAKAAPESTEDPSAEPEQ